MTSPTLPDIEAGAHVADSWKWHRTRDIGFSISFWPFQWHLGVQRSGDFFGGYICVAIGPFDFRIDGNATSGLFGKYANEVEP